MPRKYEGRPECWTSFFKLQEEAACYKNARNAYLKIAESESQSEQALGLQQRMKLSAERTTKFASDYDQCNNPLVPQKLSNFSRS